MLQFPMSIIYLILALVSSLLIAIMLRIFEKKNFNRYVIIASNYFISGSIGFFLLNHKTLPDLEIIVFGVLVGAGFFVSFVIFSISLKKEGLASTVTMGRLSLAIPVLLSIIFGSEKPQLTDILSLTTILLIIFLWEKRLSKISPILISLFLLFGLIDASMKFFKIRFELVDNSLFLITIFCSALTWSWFYILAKRIKVRQKEVLWGLVLGIPNFFSSFFILSALSGGIPAYIVFPFININLIILSSLTGNIYFSESLSRRKILLILTGIISIIFLTT